VLRVMFKHMWNTFLGVEGGDAAARGAPRRGLPVDRLGPTLDEERALYAFYLSHPRVSRSSREALAAARRGARDDKDCKAIVGAERAARESWRLERIGQLAAVDPAYPADYARGIARFRRGEYAASADAFRKWLGDHPEGPFALRARSYLRAAVDAARVE
jgi:TolA-binding protein